tara:strand:- start:547 stop:804 length:258 start_codon:yes stop_codon:yes gene_type:complete
MSGRDPLHLWPLTKGFVIPFILPILGFIYAVNSAEGRAGLEIIVLSIFGCANNRCRVLDLRVLYRTKIDDVWYNSSIIFDDFIHV